MTEYAIFPDEKTSLEWVAQIDAAYGWPDVTTQTYAVPQECEDGTWSVRIKPWLKAPVASPKWFRPVAAACCAELESSEAVAFEKPMLVAERMAVESMSLGVRDLGGGAVLSR